MIIHLHIGTPKSGTTYLQEVLGRNRQALATAGVLWPGSSWGDQVRAVRDVLGIFPNDARDPAIQGSWERLSGEMRSWDGDAVVLSMEWLVHAEPHHVDHIVSSLAPHEVRVVVTARDLARGVPAQWQEQVQNWAVWSWEEYLGAVTAEEPMEHKAGRQFWTDHDIGRMLRTWSKAVPPERMTVVTVPGRAAGPDVLWERFAGVLGLDPASYDRTVSRRNSSLGAASTELLRQVNLMTREEGLRWTFGDPVLKRLLAKGILGRRQHEEALKLPVSRRDWAERETRRIITDIESLGVPVVGSLEELVPEDSFFGDATVPTSEQMLDAALDGLTGLVLELARRVEIEMAPPPPTRLQRLYRSRSLTPVRVLTAPVRRTAQQLRNGG